MKAINLRCEYLTNPIGIDIINPLLTWEVQGGITQTAFQILAYKNEVLTFDSGKIISSSMRYAYPNALNSKDLIFWKVVLWDEEDKKEESDFASFEIGLLNKEDWKSKWIRGDYKVRTKERYPVDYFKKKFEVKDLTKARLYITSLGLYEAYINNKRVGNYILTPGSTDPRVRVQYDTYDVSNLLKIGKNEIVLLLSDGWFRGSIGAKGDTYVFGKETKILAQLVIYDSKDEPSYVLTDKSWSWSNDGEILFADLKDGEIIDKRKNPSFNGLAIESSYDGLITASNNTHVVEIEENCPIKIAKLNNSKVVLEYKDNCAGYMSFKANLKEGDTIHIVMGEMLDENKDVTLKNVQCIKKSKRTPLQEITFIAKEGLNEYKTKFFYGGFKYVSVECASSLDFNLFKQVVISTKMKETSSFECSNNLINIFYENTIRSLKSNMVDIPTDCPTRERMGWTGDSQIIFETASFLFDSNAFFRKHLRDVFDRQDKNGRLPQIAPYSAEDWFMDVMNGSVGWADVGVLIPYRMYKKYGDINILKDNYDNMVRYAKFMIKRCGRAKGLYSLYASPLHLSKENKKYGVNTGQSYGEWAEPNDVKAFVWTDFACPHPEESMAYTSYILSLMVEISNILGRNEETELFKEYSEGVKRAYQELVTKPKYSLDTNRQAKLVRPLYMNLLNDNQKEYAKKRLIESLDYYDWRLGTGFLSTPFILYVLENIDKEYAYKLLENEKMPGWLYMAINNTGTIWEGWEGPNSQLGISSLNHYSKGAMVEWLFKSMLGINIDKENHFIIKPVIGGNITFARGSYDSVYGMIKSSWEKKGDKTTYHLEIPSNTTADLYIGDKHHELKSGIFDFIY